MASCGYTRIPVIVNGCFYRHCFYGLLCTLSIAVPAGLFCGLMGWLYVDVKLMAWLFTYFPSRWLGPCIWSSFTWYLFWTYLIPLVIVLWKWYDMIVILLPIHTLHNTVLDF